MVGMRFIPKDKSVCVAMIIGFLIRIIPLLIWLSWPCIRDECTYLRLSERLINGEGMTASNGWIWAPGYPFLVSIHEMVTGYGAGIKTTQSFVSVGIIYLMFRLGSRFFDQRVGRCAAWMYALSPTQIFFAQSLWSECIYGGLLLLAVFFFDKAYEEKEQQFLNAMKVGLLVGACVLFRGVATYMIPIFLFALLWRRWRQTYVHKQVMIIVITTMCVVAPYSLYASNKFGAAMISDRTLGQMMWLGNNNFAPVTFDWGNGQLSGREFTRHTNVGRKPCAPKKKPVERDKCQTQAGIDWIKDNPMEFVQRMPLRVAQLLNPHSFITRHVRWGNWLGLPRLVDEMIVVINVFWSLVVLWFGSAGLVIYGRRSRAVLISGILLYHVAAIALLAGLSRYRVPLEPLLMLYAAQLIVHRGRIWQTVRAEKYRMVILGMVGLSVVPLTLWFLPVGWVWWDKW